MSADPTPVDDAVGRWNEAELGVEGRVLEVVRAPADVLSADGAEVDPADPEVVQLAADLVATMRIQRVNHPVLARAMGLVSWMGFQPQSLMLPALTVASVRMKARDSAIFCH